MAACIYTVSYFESSNTDFVVIICKIHNLYSKTMEDFFGAPETFKLDDRDWILELGWERYD